MIYLTIASRLLVLATGRWRLQVVTECLDPAV